MDSTRDTRDRHRQRLRQLRQQRHGGAAAAAAAAASTTRSPLEQLRDLGQSQVRGVSDQKRLQEQLVALLATLDEGTLQALARHQGADFMNALARGLKRHHATLAQRLRSATVAAAAAAAAAAAMPTLDQLLATPLPEPDEG